MSEEGTSSVPSDKNSRTDAGEISPMAETSNVANDNNSSTNADDTYIAEMSTVAETSNVANDNNTQIHSGDTCEREMITLAEISSVAKDSSGQTNADGTCKVEMSSVVATSSVANGNNSQTDVDDTCKGDMTTTGETSVIANDNSSQTKPNDTCKGEMNINEEKTTNYKQERVSVVRKGLQMLNDACDEDAKLQAMKQLRLFVSDSASALIQSGNTFSIDVDENCTCYTALLQVAINEDTHKRVAETLTPYLKRELRSFDETQTSLLIEGLWVLTNMASGNQDQTRAIADTKIIPLVVDLVTKNDNVELVAQSIMLISNIIADNETTEQVAITDRLLSTAFGFLGELRIRPVEVCRETCPGYKCNTCKSAIECGVHILHLFTSIFKSKRTVSDAHFERILLKCCAMLTDCVPPILYEVLEVLFKSSDGYGNFINIIVTYGYVPTIVSFIAHEDNVIRKKAIYIVGNLMLGSDELTWKIVRSSLFLHLPSLLYSNRETASQVLWILSNVVAGPSAMLECLFDFDLWPYIAYCLRSEDGHMVYESLWIVANFMDNASQTQKEEVLFYDTYGIVAAIVPRICTDVVYLTQKDVSDARCLDLVTEFFSMLLDFVDYFINEEGLEVRNLTENDELFDIIEHLKSAKLRSNFTAIVENMPFSTRVTECDDKLDALLSHLGVKSNDSPAS